jgi:hypothetical protein
MQEVPVTLGERFPCNCGCGRRLGKSALYVHRGRTGAAAEAATEAPRSWMAAEQCPARPPAFERVSRPLTYEEHRVPPMTWEQWLADRAQPVDVPCGQTSEGR